MKHFHSSAQERTFASDFKKAFSVLYGEAIIQLISGKQAI